MGVGHLAMSVAAVASSTEFQAGPRTQLSGSCSWRIRFRHSPWYLELHVLSCWILRKAFSCEVFISSHPFQRIYFCCNNGPHYGLPLHPWCHGQGLPSQVPHWQELDLQGENLTVKLPYVTGCNPKYFPCGSKNEIDEIIFSVLRSWSPAHYPHLLQDHHRVPRWGRRVEPHPTEGQERPLRQTTELNSLPSFCVFRMTGLVFNWCGLEHHLNKMCPCRYEGREIALSTAIKLKPDLAISSKYQGKSRLKGFKSIKFDASCST